LPQRTKENTEENKKKISKFEILKKTQNRRVPSTGLEEKKGAWRPHAVWGLFSPSVRQRRALTINYPRVQSPYKKTQDKVFDLRLKKIWSEESAELET
jgi:hypothetical protein